MLTGLENIRVSKNTPARQQLADHLRQQIFSGELAPGTQLPPISRLAKIWGVSVFTVHSALSSLSKSGLLELRNGCGTFVAERRKELKCAALYYGYSYWGGGDKAFYRLVHLALAKEFGRHGIKVWACMEVDGEEAFSMPSLRRAVLENEVQCIVGVYKGIREVKLLRNMGVPTVLFTNLKVPQKVQFDLTQFLRLGLENLRRQGATKVGLISCMPFAEEDARHDAYYRRFYEIAHEQKFKVDRSWIKAPRTFLDEMSYEEFGRESFYSIWNQPERPDGLIVWPDTVVRGALWALLRTGISVPDELRLALHRNEGLRLHCPFPATWIISRPDDIAHACVEKILRQFAGEDIEATFVPFSTATELGDEDRPASLPA